MGPCVQLALPSTGSPRVSGSPLSAVLRLAPTPRHPFRRTSYSFAWRYHGASLGNAGWERRVPACADCYRSANRFFPWRCRGLPGSWGVLVCMPRSSDPGEARHTRSLRCAGVAFRSNHDVGPHGYSLFSGLSNSAYTLAVYASQHGSPQCHARLASGWLPGLGRAGVVPAGLQWKFQFLIIPFLQALPGASWCTKLGRRYNSPPRSYAAQGVLQRP